MFPPAQSMLGLVVLLGLVTGIDSAVSSWHDLASLIKQVGVDESASFTLSSGFYASPSETINITDGRDINTYQPPLNHAPSTPSPLHGLG